MSKIIPTWNNGDYCLRTSLFAAGKQLSGIDDKDAKYYMECMIEECRMNSFHQIKSEEYTWSKSDGFTRLVYDKILKYLKVDPHKGLNGDQLRGFFIMLYLNRKNKEYSRIWYKILIGFILRLGLTPSLCELSFLKPQAYILFFKAKWFTYPIYLLIKPLFKYLAKRELENIPIKKSTTNKISLLPTMQILGIKIPDNKYCRAVYSRYFKKSGKINFIGNALYEGIAKHNV